MGVTVSVEMIVVMGMGVIVLVCVGMLVGVGNTVVGVLVGMGMFVVVGVFAACHVIVMNMHKCSPYYFNSSSKA